MENASDFHELEAVFFDFSLVLFLQRTLLGEAWQFEKSDQRTLLQHIFDRYSLIPCGKW